MLSVLRHMYWHVIALFVLLYFLAQRHLKNITVTDTQTQLSILFTELALMSASFKKNVSPGNLDKGRGEKMS